MNEDNITIPQKFLKQIGDFLQSQIKRLERRKVELEKEDPFADVTRITNNASPDTDAEEQFGHARLSALREEIERKIIQTKKALARLKIGKYGICESCGKMIDTDRLMIQPEATLCVSCAKKKGK